MGRALEQLRALFFRFFFRLLLVAIAVAEWACLAWLVRLVGGRPPAVTYLVAPLGFYAFNRWIISRRRPPGPVVRAIVRIYVVAAFTSIFCALFLALAGIGWLALLAAGAGPEIRHAYEWGVDIGFATVAGILLSGYTIGPRRLTISRLTVTMPGLPASLSGLRIVHLSDLHIGQHLGLAELADHVARVNALEPDVICLTGDLVDRAETCDLAFPTLAGLRARHGVLVTLGNHDVYAGADLVTASLRQHTDFTVLRNDRAHIRRNGAALAVLGIDDLGRDWARGVLEHPALPPLAAEVQRGERFLVLSHRPDCFPQAARLGAGLMLAGHTHGGQLALPAWRGRKPRNLAQFISAFDRGVFRDGDATLYVNRGLGFTAQKIRLFTPREIVCIELRA